MYEQALKSKENDLKIQAAFQGVDLFGDGKGTKETQQSSQKQPANQTLPLFRDPSEYDHMSQEERQNLTEKMKKQHESWVKKGKLPKG